MEYIINNVVGDPILNTGRVYLKFIKKFSHLNAVRASDVFPIGSIGPLVFVVNSTRETEIKGKGRVRSNFFLFN